MKTPMVWVLMSLASTMALLQVGCSSSSTPNGPPGPSSGDPVSTVTIPRVGSATPEPSATVSLSAPVATSMAGVPRFEGVHCSSDADCGWDEPCVPTRCQGKSDGLEIKCAETRPPPGDCGCFGDWCTLKPEPGYRGVHGVQHCNSDHQCAVQVETASCVAVDDAREVLSIGPIDREGPYCDCFAGQCELRWQEPLACRTDGECWWERKGGRLKPTRPKRPRKLPFRPCHDGEIDAVCRNGICLVRGWSC